MHMMRRIQTVVYGYGAIVANNVLTPIFVITLILVVALSILGQRTDAIFLSSVIVFNTVIAVIQESRARYRLDQLALLNIKTVRRVLGDGVEIIGIDKIAVGDELKLELGDQLLADGVITVATGLELDEALLTGEAVAVPATAGKQAFAGSMVSAGQGVIRVTAIGIGSWAGGIDKQLKATSRRQTPLQRALNRTVSALTVVAAVMSVIILVNGRLEDHALAGTVRTIVTAAISLVPEGLILASSLLLGYSAVKMAKKHILVQRLAAIEGFGRLEYLCLDKTGTLTGPDLEFEQMVLVDPGLTASVRRHLGALAYTGHRSPTIQAMVRGLKLVPTPGLTEQIAFSSSRKYSAVGYKYEGRLYHVALGAPDILQEDLSPELQARLAAWVASGLRVLMLASFESPGAFTLQEATATSATPLAFIVLRGKLRPGIVDVISRLQKNGVHIQVISGDHLGTVQAVAAEVGIEGYENGLTGADLERLPDNQWEKAVFNTTIFARVTPEQKLRLIKQFRSRGYTGMVGDGVNDALALKHADLGIAMAEGSAAARNVADVVLLDNSFRGLPVAIRLASEFVIRLELIAGLFFNRAIYGSLILIMTLIAGVEFPFLPRQVTMMNWFVVALPSIFWSVQPLTVVRRINPKRFFASTLGFAIPNGIISGIAIGAVYLLNAFNAESGSLALRSASVSAMLTTMVLGVAAFLFIPLGLGAKSPKLLHHQLLASLAVASFVAVALMAGGSTFRRFFEIVPVGIAAFVTAGTAVLIAGAFQYGVIARKKIIVEV